MDNEMLDIIVRILKGEASPDDKLRMTAWLSSDHANLEVFKQSESVWNALEIAKQVKVYNSEDAFMRFKEQVSKRMSTSRRIGLYKRIDWFLRIAAIIVIFGGISYLLTFQRRGRNTPVEISSSEIIAPTGSKAQLLLPDGTEVWLNSESKISYTNGFNIDTREVSLEGEGYFEVAKNSGKPFIVNTSEIRIKALGTIFNIKNYPGEETIETTLIDGKVEVEKNIAEKPTTLVSMDPNQKVTYYKLEPGENDGNSDALKGNDSKLPKGKIVWNKNIDPSLMTSWKDGILYFDNETFQDLAIKLERNFGVSIHFLGEDIKRLRFTGKFKDIIIEQVLEALQFASPFYYKINDKDIYISGKPIREIPK